MKPEPEVTIAQRVSQCIARSGRTRADVAASALMSQTAMSKSLNGVRQLSAVDLARLAATLGVSVYWLITGEEDPAEPRLAARHSYDAAIRRYRTNGPSEDDQLLSDLKLIYQQAYYV